MRLHLFTDKTMWAMWFWLRRHTVTHVMKDTCLLNVCTIRLLTFWLLGVLLCLTHLKQPERNHRVWIKKSTNYKSTLWNIIFKQGEREVRIMPQNGVSASLTATIFWLIYFVHMQSCSNDANMSEVTQKPALLPNYSDKSSDNWWSKLTKSIWLDMRFKNVI